MAEDDDEPVAEFRDRPDRPERATEPAPERQDRFAAERAAIRAAMDEAMSDPAFALSPDEVADLHRPGGDRAAHPYRQALDTVLPGPDGPKTPRDSLRDMPGLGGDAAERHLGGAELGERPWLRPAGMATPEARRVIATVDLGGGHHLSRHEGAAAGRVARDRVELLHDPANPDADSRAKSEDAFVRGADGAAGRHRCGPEATAIADPDAFATAVARAQERPEVRAVLDAPVGSGGSPPVVEVGIGDLLGPNGHEACDGYRLLPIDGSQSKALQNRAEWAKTQMDGLPTSASRPRSERIGTFEDGTMLIVFQPRADGKGHEVKTLYPNPPRS